MKSKTPMPYHHAVAEQVFQYRNKSSSFLVRNQKPRRHLICDYTSKNFFHLSYVLHALLLIVALLRANVSCAQTEQKIFPPSNIENMQTLPFSAQGQSTTANATLQLEAHMTQGSPTIKNDLVWRVFASKINKNNNLPLIAYSKGGSVEFSLAPGDYLVHVAFGRAGSTQHITLEANKTFSKQMVLNAGGIKFNAILPDGKINESQLKFSIYADSNQSTEQALITANVKPNTIVRLNADTYHVVSNYGTANAIVRSDIKVTAGKLTEVTMQHRAAQITLKVIRQKGSEAMADTTWIIMNDSGDIIREIANAYAYVILAEGDYLAVAKNKSQIYQKEFSVSSGEDQEIEILAIPQNIADIESMN